MAGAATVTTDLTTCPICLNICDNPKALPCLHGFCLRCLESLLSNKLPGDKACCPVCMQEFQIPSDGVGGLRHHFIVQQLIDMNRLRENPCDKHADKEVELYCRDCKENICLLCSAVNHRDHKSIEIREMADRFRPAMNDADERVMSAISSVREQSEQTKQDAAEFLGKAEDVKKIIVATGDVVKHSVDSQINDMLMKLESVTSASSHEAESVQDKYQLALGNMESFHTYSQDLLDKGRPSDITRAACELQVRATELLDSDTTAVEYHPPHVTFTPADVTQMKRFNFIGKLTVTTKEQPGTSCLLHLYCQLFLGHLT